VQERYAESLLQTLIEIAPRVLAQGPDSAQPDYEARAAFMWAANQALNGLLGQGVAQDWSTHVLGHELTALHGLDHGQSLAVILPMNLALRCELKLPRLAQYARRVWGLTGGNGNPAENEDLAREAIARTRAFFEACGVMTRLRDYNVEAKTGDVIMERLQTRGFLPLGEQRDIDAKLVQRIIYASY
jgi:NADP-dependent alcohol dehydrogenase